MRPILIALLCSTCVASAQTPYWVPTVPGKINPLITAAELCRKGYSTRTVRPPETYTETLKKRQIASLGLPDANTRHYEEDHLISLELGGHPTDPENLWPQTYLGTCNAHIKDDLEDKLHELVCQGRITLSEAQAEISTDWVRAYNQYMGPLTCN